LIMSFMQLVMQSYRLKNQWKDIEYYSNSCHSAYLHLLN
jgi:hypothetical protein